MGFEGTDKLTHTRGLELQNFSIQWVDAEYGSEVGIVPDAGDRYSTDPSLSGSTLQNTYPVAYVPINLSSIQAGVSSHCEIREKWFGVALIGQCNGP